MQRVMIIGCSGSGKSTLARTLVARTGLPLIHLDREFWSAGWIAMEEAAWLRRVEELISAPRWIMDGNYGGTLAARVRAADTLFFSIFRGGCAC